MLKKVLLILLALALYVEALAQNQTIGGQVVDQNGAIVVNSIIKLYSGRWGELNAQSDENGRFEFRNIPPGKWLLIVRHQGFARREIEVDLTKPAKERKEFIVQLVIETRAEKVEVKSDSPEPNVEPDSNRDSIIFKENDIDNLPDDPEALAAALRLMAGNAGGPDGGEIYIDGFLSRSLPPKSSIREIRINRNPFSAEFDRVGFGRVEIITKVGQPNFSGSAFYRYNNDVLNARNPFALTRQPFELKNFGGNLSGPLLSKKGTFFVDISRNVLSDSSVINATVLDANLQIMPLRQVVKSPNRTNLLNARTDFEQNPNNTLRLRYGLSNRSGENQGIGDFALPSQAYKSSNTVHTFQLVQTSIISPQVINEARFQIEHSSRKAEGNDESPTILVSESFIGGGSPIGLTRFTDNRWELSDNLTFAARNHTVRFGARARHVTLKDFSQTNFSGTFNFTGGLSPRLVNGQIILGENGQPILETVTSIERFRRTLMFGQQGLSPNEIRLLGGGAAQFLINGGNPETEISQLDFSGFVQDDWRLRPNFSLALGLRFETQNNIPRNFDFAPRIAVAWSPITGEKKKLATVLRGGFGVFYSGFGESLVLDSVKFDGNHLQRFIVTNADFIDQFTGVPKVEDLSGFGQPITTRQIAANIQTPRSFQSAVSLEQQLPLNTLLTITYSDVRVRHALRSRNINAPSFDTVQRPLMGLGDIYQYESNGRFNSQRLSLTFSSRFWKFNSLFFKYDLGSAKSDTDGANTFPINQFDLSEEYGRSALDKRHSFVLNADISAPLGIRFSPLVIAVSGRPFNITLGDDLNGDGLFTERPAFATDLTRPSVVDTRFGVLDLDPLPGAAIIPRNFGRSTPFFAVSLRAGRTFRFNLRNEKPDVQSKQPAAKRFGLNLSAQVWNLFNHANLNLPIGNLASPFFGRATSIAGSAGAGDPLSGSRTIELQARITF